MYFKGFFYGLGFVNHNIFSTFDVLLESTI